jgi:hypothetical protein
MQSISKQSSTFGFSFSGSILSHSLGFPKLSPGFNITATNLTGLGQLCGEFGFSDAFRVPAIDAIARHRRSG